MENFIYHNPTTVIFGDDVIQTLGNYLPKDKKILMIYGGGSIKNNGVYDQVKKALTGFDYMEFSGIEPNPHYETCMQAVALIRENDIGFLLAVGGGSVLDATKFISLASCYEGEDPWDLLLNKAIAKAALPLGDVITLPATGSEMNCGAVISRISTKEKLAIINPLVFPVFSVIDPSVTCSLPTRQLVNGVVDTFVHICEQILTVESNSPVVDRMGHAVLRTLVEEAPKALKSPKDIAIRKNLFWASTVGLNGWLGVGMVQDWSVHMIGHELTAVYGLDHGQTLAIVLPRVWRFNFDSKYKKLAQFGRDVFALQGANDEDVASAAICKTVQFFNSIGMKTNLSDYNILAKEAAEKISSRIKERGAKFGELANIDSEAIAHILSSC